MLVLGAVLELTVRSLAESGEFNNGANQVRSLM